MVGTRQITEVNPPVAYYPNYDYETDKRVMARKSANTNGPSVYFPTRPVNTGTPYFPVTDESDESEDDE